MNRAPNGRELNRRWLSLEAPSANVPLLLRSLTGAESMSELSSFRLEFEVDSAFRRPCDKLFEELVGRPATVHIDLPDAPSRRFSGIVAWLSKDAETDAAIRYSAELVPPLWRTTQHTNSRIFQRKSVVEILTQLLKAEHHLDIALELADGYEPHNYCVQYRETDFNFVSRLMAEEGIYYYFRPAPNNGCQMVIGDNSTLKPSNENEFAAIVDRTAGGTRPEPRIHAWSRRQQAGVARFRLRDHCFQRTGESFEVLDSLPDFTQCGKSVHVLNIAGFDEQEHYEYPGAYAHRFDGVGATLTNQTGDLDKIASVGARIAKRRKERALCELVVVQAASNCSFLTAGARLSVTAGDSDDGDYLIERVEHRAIDEPAADAGEFRARYDNSFVAIPANHAYRPRPPAAKPLIAGCQTATVMAVNDDEISCDSYGRVKVRFHWDRSHTSDADASCWVRVGQAWANKGYGWLSIPRTGDEVIVDFLDGDPDCPLIVGSVYNDRCPPPVTLPEERTSTFLRTKSKGDDSGYSGFGFTDQGGKEFFQLRAQRDRTDTTNDSFYENVGKSRYSMVGGRSVTQVGGLPFINFSRNVESDSSGEGGSDETPPPEYTETGSGAGGSTGSVYYSGKTWDSSVYGNFGEVLNCTLGVKNDAHIGFNVSLVMGSRLTTTINPLGAATYFGSPVGDVGSPPGAALTAFAAGNGTLTFAVGSKTDMVYGPTIKVTRGPGLEVKVGGSGWGALTAFDTMAKAACFFTIAAHVGMRLTWLFNQADTKRDQLIIGLAGAAVPELATGLLAYMEFKRAYLAQALALAAKAARDATTAAAQIVATPPLNEALDDLNQAGALIARMASPTTASANEAHPTHVNQGEFYGLTADRIELFSAPGELSTVPSAVAIKAAGSNGMGGIVYLAGGETCHLSGGSFAFLNLTTPPTGVSSIELDGGALGEIQIRMGVAGMPSSLIKMTPTELMLTGDPTGMSKIVLTATGISLVSGPSKLDLTPAGVTLHGPLAEVSADTDLTLSSTMTATATGTMSLALSSPLEVGVKTLKMNVAP